MKSIPEVCEILNITEDQLRRRCVAYGIKPEKIKNQTMYTEKEVKTLKGEPEYLSAEALATYIGVPKKDLVLSKNTKINGKTVIYDVKDTCRLTPKPDTTKLNAQSLAARFHVSVYRITPVLTDEMKAYALHHNGEYPEESVALLEEHFEKYASVKELDAEVPISQAEIRRIISREGIEPAMRIKGMYIYNKAEVLKAIDMRSIVRDMATNRRVTKAMNKLAESPQELIELMYRDMKGNYDLPETAEIIYEYVKAEAKKMKTDKTFTRIQAITAECYRIIETLDDEVTEYTTEELIDFVDELPTESSKYRLGQISSFIIERGYDSAFNLPILYNPVYSDNEIYLKEEWNAMVVNLLDIKKHRPKALENKFYAEMWLLMLAHTFLAWRLDDFRQLPVPSIDIKPEITFAEAEMAIDEMAEACKSLVTKKTKMPLLFAHPPIQYVVPFMTAVMICKSYNKKTLLTESIYNYKHLKDLPGIPFSSRKANKTVLTYHFIVALSKEGFTDIAYQCASVARSHKPDGYGLSNTTDKYLILMPNSYGDLTDDIVVRLCNNGSFGYLYEDLLSILTKGNSKGATFQKKSDAIALLQETFSPHEAEEFADYFLNSIDRKKNIIEKYQDRIPELRAHLEKAFKENNSKLDQVICISLDGCPYGTSADCESCVYSLIPYHMITEVVKSVKDLIAKYESIITTTEGMKNYRKKLKKDIMHQIELLRCFQERFKDNEHVLELLKLTTDSQKGITYESKSSSKENPLLPGTSDRDQDED